MSASNHYKRFQLTGKISSTQKCDDSLDRPSPPGFVVGFELELAEPTPPSARRQSEAGVGQGEQPAPPREQGGAC